MMGDDLAAALHRVRVLEVRLQDYGDMNDRMLTELYVARKRIAALEAALEQRLRGLRDA